jgi:hypothetical protein
LLVFDEGLPGFGLRVRGGGKRTWIVQYRIGQKQRRVTLGNVETIDADNARRRAKKALSKVNLGTERVHGSSPCAPTIKINDLARINCESAVRLRLW